MYSYFIGYRKEYEVKFTGHFGVIFFPLIFIDVRSRKHLGNSKGGQMVISIKSIVRILKVNKAEEPSAS